MVDVAEQKTEESFKLTDGFERVHARLGMSRTSTHTLLPDPTPRERKYLIFSVDDHFLEPKDVYTKRLPKKLLDRAPHVVEDEEGVEYWTFENGEREPILSSNGTAGRPIEEWALQPLRYDEFRPGLWNPAARLSDMDIDGVWASLSFPQIGIGFCGQRFMRISDPELGLACMRAYNDWIIEEWTATDPERLIPAQITWIADVELAAEEVRRNADRGFKAVYFSEIPARLGLPSIHTGYWDPLMAACEETETVVLMHGGSSSTVTQPSPDSPGMTVRALFPMNAQMAAADWLFSGIPLRFPDLRFVFSEGGAGWVPALIDRLEDVQQELANPRLAHEWPSDAPPPSEVLLHSFRFSSLYDPTAYALLDRIGADKIMIETDYPHQDTMWPDSQLAADKQLAHLAPDDIRKITHENAAALFRHPIPETWRE